MKKQHTEKKGVMPKTMRGAIARLKGRSSSAPVAEKSLSEVFPVAAEKAAEEQAEEQERLKEVRLLGEILESLRKKRIEEETKKAEESQAFGKPELPDYFYG